MNLKKLKRLKPPPVPGQVKLLSLLAIVLVCAAPALVSVLDDTVNQQYDMPLTVDFTDPLIYPNNTRLQGDPVEATDLGVDIITEDNVITILSSTPGYTGILSIFMIDKAVVKDASKILITSSSEYSSLYIEAGDHDVYGTYDPDLGQYTFSLSSIDRNYIMQTESDYLGINAVNTSSSGRTFAAVETLTIDVYGSVMIPYAEIIIGATGALLLICALMATPWFGIGKIGKRRSKS